MRVMWPLYSPNGTKSCIALHAMLCLVSYPGQCMRSDDNRVGQCLTNLPLYPECPQTPRIRYAGQDQLVPAGDNSSAQTVSCFTHALSSKLTLRACEPVLSSKITWLSNSYESGQDMRLYYRSIGFSFRITEGTKQYIIV